MKEGTNLRPRCPTPTLVPKGSYVTKHTYIMGRETHLGLYVEGVPHVPKILVMGQSNGSFRRVEKKH
jgi:hypothetical protein